MSFLNMFGGAPKKEAPADEPVATGSGENPQEGEIMGFQETPTEVYSNHGGPIISDKTERDEILEQRRNREQD